VPITTEDMLHGAGPSLKLLRSELERRWSAAPDPISEIGRYALLPPGKMLRPLLLLESAAAVGGDRHMVLPAALAIEYLHVGSLIHDDVIDKDDMRRGRPSVPARYGVANAIVAGDRLLMAIFSALADCAERGVPEHRVLKVQRILVQTGTDLCHGQALEEQQCGVLDRGLDPYFTVIGLKTGALFRGTCRIGAILGGASHREEQALDSFAKHLGVAFQIYDDLLPYLADSTTVGKPSTSDIVNRRSTFPVLLGYELSNDADRRGIELAVSGELPAEPAYDTLKEILHRTGALESSQLRATAEVDNALRALEEVPSSPSTELLGRIARRAVARES
jgi:geranylgeranyl pyrophosphate synthase